MCWRSWGEENNWCSGEIMFSIWNSGVTLREAFFQDLFLDFLLRNLNAIVIKNQTLGWLCFHALYSSFSLSTGSTCWAECDLAAAILK